MTVVVVVAIVLLSGASLASADEVYRWTDPNGRVHYSNSPQVGSESVDLQDVSLSVPTAQPAAAQESRSALVPEGSGDGHGGEPSDGAAVPPANGSAAETRAALQRQSLERQLRELRGQIRTVDGRIASIAAARRRIARDTTATGGVAPADVESGEEKTLAAERDELTRRQEELRAEADKLRAQ